MNKTNEKEENKTRRMTTTMKIQGDDVDEFRTEQ